MGSDVLTAFDVLLEEMTSKNAQLAEAMKEATLNAQFTEAQRLLAKAKRVGQLMEQVRQLRAAWERLDEETAETFAVMERITERQVEAVPAEEETPELASANQLFGGGQRRKRGRRHPVNRTPGHAYRVPILEALEQLGGSGRMREVLKIVYDKMKERLTEDDLKPLPSGIDIRWSNAARWERYNMVNEGLLRNDSPTGVWEITEKGKAYLERVRREGEVR